MPKEERVASRKLMMVTKQQPSRAGAPCGDTTSLRARSPSGATSARASCVVTRTRRRSVRASSCGMTWQVVLNFSLSERCSKDEGGRGRNRCHGGRRGQLPLPRTLAAERRTSRRRSSGSRVTARLWLILSLRTRRRRQGA